MTVPNKATVDLVKDFEGFGAKAYLCPAGVWTIGYGHTAGVKKGQTITKAEAERLLSKDLADFWARMRSSIKVKLSDNQAGALLSFAYNVGVGGFKSSSALREANKGNHDRVPEKLALWNKATVNRKKVVLSGLVRRRAAEGAFYASNSTGMVQRVDEPVGKPATQSTTVGAAVGTVLVTVGGAAAAQNTGFGTIALLGMIVVVAGLAFYIIRERVKKSKMDGV